MRRVVVGRSAGAYAQAWGQGQEGVVQPSNEQEGVGGGYMQMGRRKYWWWEGRCGRSGLGKQWRAQTGGRGRTTNGQPKKEQYCGELNSGVWIETKFMTRGDRLVGLEKGEPWLPLAVVLSHF